MHAMHGAQEVTCDAHQRQVLAHCARDSIDHAEAAHCEGDHHAADAPCTCKAVCRIAWHRMQLAVRGWSQRMVRLVHAMQSIQSAAPSRCSTRTCVELIAAVRHLEAASVELVQQRHVEVAWVASTCSLGAQGRDSMLGHVEASGNME